MNTITININKEKIVQQRLTDASSSKYKRVTLENIIEASTTSSLRSN